MQYARYGLFVIAALGLVGSFGYLVYIPPADPVVITGMSAPDLNGELVYFDDFQGDILVIDFWATWCHPCITEIPHYNAFDEDYRDDDSVHLIGLTVESGSAEDVVAWMDEDPGHVITYPLVMATAEVINAYGPVFGFPTTLPIDQEGKIVKRWIGAAVNKTDQLREMVEQLKAGEEIE